MKKREQLSDDNGPYNAHLEVQYVVSKFHNMIRQEIFIPEPNPNKLEGQSADVALGFKNKMYHL